MASPPGEITAEPPADPPGRESRRLKPVLGVTAVILLTVSCITPASSLFIIVPELLATQGSGVVIALLLGVVVSIAVGACYAELGTRTPSSGGEYAMSPYRPPDNGRKASHRRPVFACTVRDRPSRADP
jgi:hypothetical protein